MSSVYCKLPLVAIVLAMGASGVSADETLNADQRDNVRNRARPAYDAIGIHAGGFTVFPVASVAGKYDDNIYATDVNETDDFITELSTAVKVNSNWSRHALNFKAGVTQSVFAAHTDENRLDWDVGVDGKIDVTRDTQLRGSFAYQQEHEDRGDPNAPTAATEPTKYTLLTSSVSVDQKFNRLTARISGDYSKYDYKDVVSTVGAVIDQDNRDRQQYEEALRLGYDISPDTNAYVQGTLNQRIYDLTMPVVAVNRDSDGYAVVVGSDFRLSNLMQGGIFVGYQEQAYDDLTLAESSGLAYGANLEWYVTPLTTLTFEAASTIEETTTVGASGYNAQTAGIRFDHELLRNVLLNGRVSYESDDYEGMSRTDDKIRAGLGVDYLMNRNFSLSLGYDYTDNNSNVMGNDYKRNVVGLTLSGKL
ncbi:MAG: outer membrane beta-barrel protein [Parvibaculaceae bacterium]